VLDASSRGLNPRRVKENIFLPIRLKKACMEGEEIILQIKSGILEHSKEKLRLLVLKIDMQEPLNPLRYPDG
jgi:hypothetical protein